MKRNRPDKLQIRSSTPEFLIFATQADENSIEVRVADELREDPVIRKFQTTASLEISQRDIVQNAGKVTAEIARNHAESEFEKYRIVQDRLFESDFDRVVKEIVKSKPENEE